MRELKFRAFDKKENKWLFGYELPNLGGFSLTGEMVLLGELGSIPLQDWNHIEIMQFTGLLDKNGKEIYEGDIVKIPFHDGIKEYNSEIKWNGTGWNINDHGSNKDVEIIGNIYENPELIN